VQGLWRVYPGAHPSDRSVLSSRVPYKVLRFQPTPNPNALKCILDGALPEPIRSYRAPAEGQGDPLACELFAIPGVTGLLISGKWITVSKDGGADWLAIRSGVEAVLQKA